MTQVKICGLTTREAIDVAIDAGADYLGLVHFAKSPRHLNLSDAGELAKRMRGRVKSVLLLVNPGHSLIDEAMRKVCPDYIQLHGTESVEDVRAIRRRANVPIIKAIAVATREDIEAAKAYEDVADMLLFDAKPHKDALLPGGNGIPFDWNLLSGFNSYKDYMLSGGLALQSVAKAIKISGAPIVDVSSGVERSPGIKDLDKIRQFTEMAKA